MLSEQKSLGSKKDRRLDETAEILEKAEILQTPRAAGMHIYGQTTISNHPKWRPFLEGFHY